MTTIRSIVAATDFSPGSYAVVERAVQLAVAHGASLRLLSERMLKGGVASWKFSRRDAIL